MQFFFQKSIFWRSVLISWVILFLQHKIILYIQNINKLLEMTPILMEPCKKRKYQSMDKTTYTYHQIAYR